MSNYILVKSFNKANIQNRLYYAMKQDDLEDLKQTGKLTFGDRAYTVKGKKFYVYGEDEVWYEVGGEDISPELLEDMNEVFNRKFGTSSDYPPEIWAKTVNIMGPLPQKTVSGAVASFSDGAKGTPLIDLTAQIVPQQSGSGDPSPSNPRAISGYTSGTITQTGKNLLNSSLIEQDGNNRIMLADNLYLKATTYNISLETLKIANFYYRKHGEANWTNVGGYNKTSVNITIDSEDYYDISYYISTGILVSDLSSIQLEVGNTKTDYTNFVTPTTETVQFGQTVYGGTWKAKEGKVIPKGFITFDGTEPGWLFSTSSGSSRVFILISDAIHENTDDLYCNILKADGGSYSGYPEIDCCFINSNGYLMVGVDPTTITSADDWKTLLSGTNMELSYPLATPTEISVDAVNLTARDGVNNIFADTGNSSVTYYADIDLYIAELEAQIPTNP